MTIVAVSGGFDPLHRGHLSLFDVARPMTGRLVVIVDSDEFILAKRGRPPQQSQRDRATVLLRIKGVDRVVESDGPDACEAIRAVRPDIYCVGADHADLNFPERAVCAELGIPVMPLTHGCPDIHSRDLLASQAKPKWVNPPVTVDGLIERAGKLLVMRRGAACEGEGMLDLPGGFLEVGEDLEDCLCRELVEEIGVDNRHLHSLRYGGSAHGVLADGRQFVNVIFECGATQAFRPLTTPEASEILWCDRMPPGGWFSECCRKAAEGWFGRRLRG